MRTGRRVVKKAVQQGRSERRGESYSGRYVESLSDARTLLADFFNTLLETSPAHMALPIEICVPARRIVAGGAQLPYRPAVRLRQPHWQLICSQRQALAWHPQEQDAHSQVPQQLVLAIFCTGVLFMSAMAGLL